MNTSLASGITPHDLNGLQERRIRAAPLPARRPPAAVLTLPVMSR